MEKKLPIKYEEKKILVTDGLGFAWDKKTFIQFLTDKETKNFAVLGGDVLNLDDSGNYKNTYDNWSTDRKGSSESFSDYCKRSREKAKEYVELYPATERTFFAPVMSSELTAGL